MRTHSSFSSFAVLATLLGSVAQAGAQTPTLSSDQIREFLQKAEVVGSHTIAVGVTKSWRLTLRDGSTTHDAHFQSVDIRRNPGRFDPGAEPKFADSYKFNIAAYRLAKLLGLDGMVPVSVERIWHGQTGAMTWWVDDFVMTEKLRQSNRVRPSNTERWRDQTQRMHVFAALVDDTDRNQGNVLYDTSWNLWMIDFTRAFRVRHEIRKPKKLQRCDRDLLAKMRQLDEGTLREALQPYLTTAEVRGVLKRRDRIVAHFKSLIAGQGKGAVLY